jgi:hypothetical protein
LRALEAKFAQDLPQRYETFDDARFDAFALASLEIETVIAEATAAGYRLTLEEDYTSGRAVPAALCAERGRLSLEYWANLPTVWRLESAWRSALRTYAAAATAARTFWELEKGNERRPMPQK